MFVFKVNKIFNCVCPAKVQPNKVPFMADLALLTIEFDIPVLTDQRILELFLQGLLIKMRQSADTIGGEDGHGKLHNSSPATAEGHHGSTGAKPIPEVQGRGGVDKEAPAGREATPALGPSRLGSFGSSSKDRPSRNWVGHGGCPTHSPPPVSFSTGLHTEYLMGPGVSSGGGR